MASSKKSKKGAVVEEPVILGRPGNNVKMGIVGLPNVGKSTIFNVLCSQQVPAENFPFCTIDPHVARVLVPDERWRYLCDVYKPKSEVQASLKITDIAGLVKGAAEGAGLGNAFLANISAVDGIYHVVRAFKAKEIEHVEGDVNPVRDLEIISNELRLKDIEFMKRKVDECAALAGRSKDKKVKDEHLIAIKVHEWLLDGKDVRVGKWNAKEIEFLNTMLLLSAKPVTFLVNVSLKNWQQGKNKFLKPIKEWVDVNCPGGKTLPFCASFERELADQTPESRAEWLKEQGGMPSQIDKIVWAGYKGLGLIHYFTAGEDEVRCWTIRKYTKARQAAGVIHTDFEKAFICAEVMSYDDFKAIGNEQAVRAAGKYRTEGKEYVCQDGDIMHFKVGQVNDAKKK